MALISSETEFSALLDRLRDQPEVALDCEFHGEGRYRPRLCLVQVAFGEEAVAIDPFEVDLEPLADLLADPSIRKVFHAAENDLPLLVRTPSLPARNVFDTQIAAAFVGHGATPAYTVLVERLCGVSLSKQSRFSQWDSRPLSEAQVVYALQDVRYLGRMAHILTNELRLLGRTEWAEQEMQETVARALTPRDRSLLYLKLGPFRDMTPRNMAVLREVARWRDERAAKFDRPVQTIAPDEALRQLAFSPRRSAEEILRLRGLQRLGDGVGSLMSAIGRGLATPDSECPAVPETARDERTDVISSLLATALRVRANELKIAPALIARRDQLEALIAWDDGGRSGEPPEIVRPDGWKRAAAGELLLSVLDGKYSLGVSPTAPDGAVLIAARTS